MMLPMANLVSIKVSLHGAERPTPYFAVEVQMDGWGYADSIKVGAAPEQVAAFFRGLARNALSQSRVDPKGIVIEDCVFTPPETSAEPSGTR